MTTWHRVNQCAAWSLPVNSDKDIMDLHRQLWPTELFDAQEETRLGFSAWLQLICSGEVQSLSETGLRPKSSPLLTEFVRKKKRRQAFSIWYSSLVLMNKQNVADLMKRNCWKWLKWFAAVYFQCSVFCKLWVEGISWPVCPPASFHELDQ